MRREVHVYATFVHGALCALHTVGVVYAFKNGNTVDGLVHAFAGVFSLNATCHHARVVRDEDRLAAAA